MQRILNVLRLHLVDRWSYVYVPLIILVFTFIINLLIWGLIMANVDARVEAPDLATGYVPEGPDGFTGALSGTFFYLLVMAIMSINATFPYSQALSITRKEFYLGTISLSVVVGIVAAVLIYLLLLVERATGGWGVGMDFFGIVWISDGPWYVVMFVYFVITQFFFYVGILCAVIYLRWKTNGVLLFTGIVLLAMIGLVALATFTDAWPAVGSWFVSQTNASLFAWLLVPILAFAACGYLVLRRTATR